MQETTPQFLLKYIEKHFKLRLRNISLFHYSYHLNKMRMSATITSNNFHIMKCIIIFSIIKNEMQTVGTGKRAHIQF